MLLRILLVISIVQFAFTTPVAGATEKIFVTAIPSETNRYCIGLLKRAIAHSGASYQFEDFYAFSETQMREIDFVNSGKVSVMWTGTSEKLEEELLPIRIPVFRGFLGHRIFVIAEGTQQRFDNVRSLDDLRAFTLGQGTGWSDTPILEANNLNVVKTPKYNSLFQMVDAGRFDAFPRGVLEIWGEMVVQGEGNGLKIEVEDNIMLVYKMPMYFFVAKENTKLAKDIETGLLKMLDNGEFNEYFFNDPMIKAAMENGNLAKRRIFHLQNPSLPAATPLDNKILWLDLSEIDSE